MALKVCTISLYAWGVIGSFKDEICIAGYAPHLNRTCFFKGFKLSVDWNVPKKGIRVPKSCSYCLYTCGVIGSFEDEICTNGYAPPLI